MIKLLCSDVDGVMTDNKLHVSATGELFKTFNARDGWALKEILPKNGIEPAVITGRKSQIVPNRCEELGVSLVFCGRDDKNAVVTQLAKEKGYSLSEIAFIGDDYNDLPAIKLAGLSGCPSDAIEPVKATVTYICKAKGGEGALREFVEWIVAQQSEEKA
jgi:3-deoxy-D-manno-octulosonate 8-phosphate phosphatase (KDO 8-P phosphatase)